MRVLITGGRGNLGRRVVAAARRAGHDVVVLSRNGRPETARPDVEWVSGELVSRRGLAEAVRGAAALVHCASDPRNARLVDVTGTRHLGEAAREAGVGHLVYVSIIGVDSVPFDYYRRKLEAEGAVTSSGVPWTIVRAAQFHSFIEALIAKLARTPLVLPLPADFKFQTVDEEDVAMRLVRGLHDGPRRGRIDFGGPQVLSLGEMARAWLRVRGLRKPILPLPIPGALAAAYRRGGTTPPEGERGSVSWEEWLGRSSEDAPGS